MLKTPEPYGSGVFVYLLTLNQVSYLIYLDQVPIWKALIPDVKAPVR